MARIEDYEIAEAPVELTALAAADVEEYWSDERKAAAEPVPVLELEGEPPREQAEFQMEALADEEPTREEPRLPDGVDEPGAGTGCFTTTQVADMDVWPYMAVGKLFMTFEGRDFVGSAWTINESAVFTAGHCVYDTDTDSWASQLLFEPRYANGNSIGQWTSARTVSLTCWTDDEDFACDMGAFITNRPIRPTTGSLGWWANTASSTGSPFDAVGYPASSVPGFAFDGETMWHCVGDYQSGTDPYQMCNNMTGGCSGGPWVMTANGVAYAKGLNSFRFRSQPERMFSPNFDNSFLALVNWIANNGGTA